MSAFAVVDDYRLSESGIYLRTHAVILVNGCKEPPCKTLVYFANNSIKTQNDELTQFLESYVSKYYDLYATEKYHAVYGELTESLKHKFITKRLYDAPIEMQGKISTYLLLAFEQAEKAAEKSMMEIQRNHRLVQNSTINSRVSQ